MRHTKIIATLGPSTSSPGSVDELIAAGVNVFRLNFSHGTHASHAESVAMVRAAAVRADVHIAILQDLSGPKIRTGALEGGQPIDLGRGSTLRLAAGEGLGNARRVFTPYAPLVESAEPGDRLLLDDGKIELRVVGREAGDLVTEVVSGHRLGEHKGINAPGVKLPASAFTLKDEADLRFGLSVGIDLVALSFVQCAADVLAARAIVDAAGAGVPIVAKIERPQALEHLDAILDAADAVMVARGDLGLECRLEQVPRVQKLIVAHARARGRPVIVATQVLESMRAEPRPTRAEVSDAATAVDQGVDAIMLAGETASGAYPVEAVRTLREIIEDAEAAAPIAASVVDPPHSLPDGFDAVQALHGRAMCDAAVTLASSGHADAIVAITTAGRTAQLLSSRRPRAAILAVTPSASVARRLTLWWGVHPLVSELQNLSALEGRVRDAGRLPARAVVVFINISPDLARQDANFLNVQRLEENRPDDSTRKRPSPRRA